MHPLLLALGAAVALLLELQQPSGTTVGPGVIRDLGDVGTFLLGAAAAGGVVAWGIRNFKGLGSSGSAANLSALVNTEARAEQRINTAVQRMLEELHREVTEMEERLTERIDKLPIERRRRPR